jgi:hypothetical protein
MKKELNKYTVVLAERRIDPKTDTICFRFGKAAIGSVTVQVEATSPAMAVKKACTKVNSLIPEDRHKEYELECIVVFEGRILPTNSYHPNVKRK